MDTYPISACSLEKFYYIDGHQLERQYKEHLSDYREWEDEDGSHAEEYLVFPENVGPHLSIDETSLSDGELYTIVTNKDAHGRKGAIVAIVAGTKSETVYTALWKIDKELREKVEEITLDLSSSMKTIAIMAFPKATKVIDRFHVQKLALDAVQELRIKFRWDAMDRENAMKREAKAKGEDFKPEIFSNGDTEKQLLIRSRYLLFKARKFWTESQQKRAQILFSRYPDLETAYKLAKWYNAVDESGFESFKTISETIQTSYERVLNFFENRSTNASAESFNAKIKAFRAQLRGIRDVKYFLFRLKNIYA